ncbi:MAG: hypothetical protein LUE90_01265 [Clostridiales bacterium]|nr:hypothetical protein [Clostridiales bacterium]
MKDERTTDLLNELNSMDDKPESFQAFMERHASAQTFHTLADYLNYYISQNSELHIADVIKRSNTGKNYSYQIFNGRKKHPDKYKLIPLCIAMKMSVKETNRALFMAGQPALAPTENLDAALIICINHEYTDMISVNEFLAANGLAPL